MVKLTEVFYTIFAGYGLGTMAAQIYSWLIKRGK